VLVLSFLAALSTNLSSFIIILSEAELPNKISFYPIFGHGIILMDADM
jgi:hypothetical protein